MAALTRVAVQPAGTSAGLVNATVGGDTYVPSTGRERLLVQNLDATSTNVTIATFATRAGLVYPARVVAVAAGDVAVIPLLDVYKDPANGGRMSFTYSKVTGPLKVSVVD